MYGYRRLRIVLRFALTFSAFVLLAIGLSTSRASAQTLLVTDSPNVSAGFFNVTATGYFYQTTGGWFYWEWSIDGGAQTGYGGFEEAMADTNVLVSVDLTVPNQQLHGHHTCDWYGIFVTNNGPVYEWHQTASATFP